MGESGGPASTVVDARSTTVVEIGTVVVAGSAVVVGGTAAVDGTTAVAGVAVVVRDTVVVAGTTVVVGATVVVGVAVAVGVVVAAVVVDSAEVEVGAAVSELPPHPETTNKTVTATACALTFQVCHPSPGGWGDAFSLVRNSDAAAWTEVEGFGHDQMRTLACAAPQQTISGPRRPAPASPRTPEPLPCGRGSDRNGCGGRPPCRGTLPSHRSPLGSGSPSCSGRPPSVPQPIA